MPTINVRWSDNTKDLQKNLREGLQTMEATRSSVDKLVKAFNGDNLIQAAHKWAVAIDQIGGVTKLTAAKQEQANAIFAKAAEQLTVMGKGGTYAAEQFKLLAAQTQQLNVPPPTALNRWVGDLGKSIVATAAGFVSAQAVMGAVSGSWRTLTAFVGDSVHSYADAEAAQVKLTAALHAQGMATPAIIDQYNALSTEFQKTTVFSDDLITSMQALMVEVGGVMPSQMRGAIQASADLASGLGIDLETATRLVARAAAGHTETLGKYGITVDEAKAKTDGFGAVLEAINSQFGGQAAAQIETYAGKVQQLANNWDNVKEAIGAVVASSPLVQGGLRMTNDVVGDLQTTAENAGGALSRLLNISGSPQVAILVALFEGWAKSANAAAAAMDQLKAAGVKPLAAHLERFPPVQSHDTETERLEKEAKKLASLHEQQAKDAKEAKDQAEKATEAQKRWIKSVQDATEAQRLSIFTLHRFGAIELPNVTASLKGADRALTDFGEVLDEKVAQKLAEIQRVGLPYFLDGIDKVGQHVEVAGTKVKKAGNDFRDLTQAFALMAQTSGGAFSTVAGDISNLFGSLNLAAEATKKFKDENASLVDKLSAVAAGVAAVAQATSRGSASMRALSGAATGAQAGAMFGPWGIAVGAAAGAIVGLVRGLGAAERAVNVTRDAFVRAAGGLDELNKRAITAGLSLNQLLNAKNPEAYKRAIDELTAAFKFQDEAMQFLNDTVKKYGFTIEELGPKFAQQNLTKMAFDLEKEFRALEAAGVDVGTISVHMKDAMNAYLQSALRTGSAVPESMREILMQLLNMGLLTDENGDAMTDLGRIKFSKGLDDQFKELLDSIHDLIDAISRGLGDALRNIPKPPPIKIPYEYVPRENDLTGAAATVLPFTARASLTPGLDASSDLGRLLPMSGMRQGNQAAKTAVVHYHIAVQAVDARGFEDMLRRGGAQALVNVIDNNAGGARTKFKESLGVA